jgi:hypothetical protein
MATEKELTKEQIALAEFEKRQARAAELAAKRAERSEARQGETKGDAFKRIATARTKNALGAIQTLSGLTNPGNYDYTQEQWAKIFGAIRAEIDEVEKLSKGEVVVKGGFEI